MEESTTMSSWPWWEKGTPKFKQRRGATSWYDEPHRHTMGTAWYASLLLFIGSCPGCWWTEEEIDLWGLSGEKTDHCGEDRLERRCKFLKGVPFSEHCKTAQKCSYFCLVSLSVHFVLCRHVRVSFHVPSNDHEATQTFDMPGRSLQGNFLKKWKSFGGTFEKGANLMPPFLKLIWIIN